MSTLANQFQLQEKLLSTRLFSLKGNTSTALFRNGINLEESIWQNFLAANRILHLLRPDYFMIYKFSNATILYQQNIKLDMGVDRVTIESIMHFMSPADRIHVAAVDKIMNHMSAEGKLQPMEYVFRICGNISCPNPELKRLMRTSMLIHCNTSGIPELGFFCFHDISSMVSSIKPNSYDITFDSEHDRLKNELVKRIKKLNIQQMDITRRELDILSFIDKGMTSKKIATCLFISKATVDTHRQNMLRKWELPNTAALLKKAREEAWI